MRRMPIRSDKVSKGPIRVEKESAKSDSEESESVRMMPQSDSREFVREQ